MDLVSPLLAVVGLLLVFFLPGYLVAKALFPEWRVRGPRGAIRAVELVTLGLILSVALTILVGFGLLNGAPSGFSASWSNPVLEGFLLAIAIVALVVGLLRGAYRPEPPAGPEPEPAPGATDGWGLVQRLEAIERERRSLRRALRGSAPGSPASTELEGRLTALEREATEIREAREKEYAR